MFVWEPRSARKEGSVDGNQANLENVLSPSPREERLNESPPPAHQPEKQQGRVDGKWLFWIILLIGIAFAVVQKVFS